MTAPVQEKIKPSAAWYVIGALLLLVAFIVPTVLTVIGFVAAYDRLTDIERVPVDGGGEVQLEAGDYTVYAEGSGVDEFTAFSTGDIEIIQPNGDPEDLSPVSGEFTYSTNGREGVAKLTFTADESGAYQVNLLESASRSPNVTDIAIGPGFSELLGESAIYFVLAAIIGLLAFVIGLILLIRTGVKRGKVKRQRRLSARSGLSGPGYGGPAQPGYPPPPGAGTPPPGFAPPPGAPPPGSPPPPGFG